MTMPSLRYLQRNATQIQFFGLGFVQVKMTPTTRYHFYHPSLPVITENPHNHRTALTSHILKGVLENRIWRLYPEDEAPADALYLEQRAVSCVRSDEKSSLPEPRYVYAKQIVSRQNAKGYGYYIDNTVHHQVFRIGARPCITHVTLSGKKRDFATVLSLKEEACPFSESMKTSELWALVRDCL